MTFKGWFFLLCLVLLASCKAGKGCDCPSWGSLYNTERGLALNLQYLSPSKAVYPHAEPKLLAGHN